MYYLIKSFGIIVLDEGDALIYNDNYS
jgi:hypothetical protein